MKEDIKYPYIADNGNGTIVLFTRVDYGFLLKKSQYSDREECFWYPWNENVFANITHEYLANTYGKVGSKEHAEFIKLLAGTNDIVFFKDTEMVKAKDVNYFSVTDDGTMYFWHDKSGIQYDRKQITIPMPPNNPTKLAINGDTADFDSMLTFKADSIKMLDAMGNMVGEFNSTSNGNDNLPNNGDNLMFGGEDKCKEYKGCLGCGSLLCLGGCGDNGKAYNFVDKLEEKEWPQIGDEVLAPFNGNKVKATLCWQRVNIAGINVSLVFDDDSRAFWCASEDLSKPKTPEEELRDELSDIIKDLINIDASNNAFVDMLIDKYNITKKPK